MFQALLLAATLALAPAPQEVEPPDRAKTEARIEALAGTEDADEQKDLTTLRATIEQLDRRDALEAQRAEFESEVEGAAAATEALQARLDGIPETDAALAAALAGTTRDEQGLGLEELEARLESLETRLGTAKEELTAARTEGEEVEREIEARRTRSTVVPTEVAAAEAQLEARLTRIAAIEAGTSETATTWLLRAEIVALRAELATLQAEIPADDARLGVLDVKRQLTNRRIVAAEAIEEALRAIVAAARERVAEKKAEDVREESERQKERLPWLDSAIERNQELVGYLGGEDGLSKLPDDVLEEIERARSERIEVERRYRAMRRRLEAGGLTEGLGRTLRRDNRWLSTPEQLQQRRRRAALRRSDAEILELELDAELDELEDNRRRLTEEARVDATAPLTEQDRELVESVFKRRRELIGDARDNCKKIRQSSVTLAERLDELVRWTDLYRAEIQQRILWVRSSSANPLEAFAELGEQFDLLEKEAAAADAITHAGDRLEKRPVEPTALMLVGIALAVFRRRIRRKLQSYAPLVRSFRTDEFAHTMRAIGLTLLLALPIPLIMLSVAFVLDGGDDDVRQAMAGALRGVGELLIALLFAREMLLADGLGPAHFRWNERRCALIRRDLTWYSTVMMVLATVYFFLDRLDNPVGIDSIGRVVFVVGMGLLASMTFALRKHVGDTSIPGSQQETIDRRFCFWLKVLAWVPITLGLLALSGFVYTAGVLEERLQFSYTLALVLLLVNATLQRWRFVLRRRLALEQARERARARAAAAAAAEGEDASGDAVEESDIDIPAVDAQTRQLFRSGITIGLLVGLFLIWSSVFTALQGLDRIQLLPYPAVLEDQGSSSGTTRLLEGAPVATTQASDGQAQGAEETAAVPQLTPTMTPLPATPTPDEASDVPTVLTLADLVVAILAALVTVVLTRNVPGLLELTLLRRLPLDAGARYAATTITRYLIIIVGGSIALTTLGLGWSKIQWLAAALTFGLAFGLQEIFANFVSGLIILVERPVRVGDVVTVDGTDGKITRLRMRATTLQDWDRREFLIPNKYFITSTVINWTLSDPISRRIVRVGVAYGTDMKTARETLLEIGNRHPNVLDEPAPHVVFASFGESSLDLELRMFVSNADNWPAILDDLHTSIDAAYRAKGIEIAFPQRDLHVRTFDPSDVAAASAERPARAPDGAS